MRSFGAAARPPAAASLPSSTAPSASTEASSSSTSTPTSAAHVSNSNSVPVSPPASSSDMINCPICNELMMTVGQLNRHLDDAHFGQESDDVSGKQAILSWFKQVKKAVGGGGGDGGSFNADGGTLATPSPAMGRTSRFGMLKKSTSFNPGGSPSNTLASIGKSLSTINFGRVIEDLRDDLMDDELAADNVAVPIRRNHWQLSDRCSAEDCSKSLVGLGGIRIGSNCRKCGRMFCDTHSAYTMRLAPDATHDPENGQWYKVCRDCFTSQRGYKDTHGRTRSISVQFLDLRARKLERSNLEGNLLEKRLLKLTEIHKRFLSRRTISTSSADISNDEDSDREAVVKLPQKYRSLREAEQSVTPWQKDELATHCHICMDRFTLFLMRKHHCRLCGKVMCGKPICSEDVSLFQNSLSSTNLHLPNHASNLSSSRSVVSSRESTASTTEQRGLDAYGKIRICSNCKQKCFKKRWHAEELLQVPAVVKLHQTLFNIRQKILEELPGFNTRLLSIETSDTERITEDPVMMEVYREAALKRKELIGLFSEFDQTSKRIAMLPTSTPLARKLCDNIFNSANHFLQNHMFTLQLLPKLDAPNKAKIEASKELTPERNEPKPAAQTSKISAFFSSVISPPVSTTSATVAVAKDWNSLSPADQNLLRVLEEQKSQLELFVAEATRNRKFDDVRSLQQNLDEIQKEISKIKF